MRVRSRAFVLCVTSAALLAGTGWGASSAIASSQSTPKNVVMFKTEHIAGVKGVVLTTGKGLVVYTFSGDKRGGPGTCAGGCAVIWPPVRGVPMRVHGAKFPGKFGRIKGQITYNGWPLYLFTGEKPRTDHADGSFKVISVKKSAPRPGPAPSPSPSPW